MKYWYNSASVKAILLVLEHLFAVVAVVAVVTFFACPGSILETGEMGVLIRNYEDTEEFSYDIRSATYDILQVANAKNPESRSGDMLVDVVTYEKTGEVSGEDVSGLTFYLKDLLNNNLVAGDWEKVFVCERGNGTYKYVERDIIEEEQEVYEQMWTMVLETSNDLKTVDGKNLLQLANTDSRWNGRLSEAQEMLRNVAHNLQSDYEAYQSVSENYSEGNTNLSYLYVDYEANTIFTNHSAYTDIKKVDTYVEELKAKGKYVVTTHRLADFETNMELQSNWLDHDYSGEYLYVAAVDTTFPIKDSFYYDKENFEMVAPIVQDLFWPGVIAAIGFIIGLFWLTCVTGRDRKENAVSLSWFDRVPLEVLLVAGIAGVVTGVLIFADNAGFYFYNQITSNGELLSCVLLAGVATLAVCAVFFLVYLSIVRRIKAKTLFKSMLISYILKWIKTFVREFIAHQKCIVKVLIGIGIYVIINWIVRCHLDMYYSWNWELFFVLGLLVDGFAAYMIIRWAISKDKLEKGIRQIAEGNIKYQISPNGLSKNDVKIAEHMNHMGDGFQKAVEQSMRDERLKTELLTNVSHDIKTPLTSIINYIDLLKRENLPDEKIQGYIQILEQKAARLKQLTEDVTEASKISSGNISIEYQNLDFVQMIQQTTGEFAEKFEKKNLSVVLDMPNPPVVVWADGRRVWRIIENLYNNVAKYAMPGTRVYATLTVAGNQAVFSLKNISEQPLNISAEELTERFIRGDVSRSTEGSGLGLSIAKELTKLQGGAFELYLDGDLFKATVSFPCIC